MKPAQLAPRIELVRLRAEAALLARLDAGFGFAEGHLASEQFIESPTIREALSDDPLRPRGLFSERIAALTLAIAAAERVESAPLATLAQRFVLDAPAQALLACGIAYELDADVRALCQRLAPNRIPGLYVDTCASIEPALRGPASLTALAADAPLRAGGLVTLTGRGARATQALELDPDLLDWLLGSESAPASLAGFLHLGAAVAPSSLAGVLPQTLGAELAALAERLAGTDSTPMVLLQGSIGSGRGASAARLAAALQRPLARLELRPVLQHGSDAAALVRRALLAARLRHALIYLPDLDALAAGDGPSEAIAFQLETHADILIVATAQRGIPQLPLTRPYQLVRLATADVAARTAAWRNALAALPTALEQLEPEELASRYVIGPGAIADVLADARAFTTASGQPLRRTHLEEAIGRRLTLRLGPFASVVSRRARFDDMVLPDDVYDTLADMIAMIRQRSTILERWGYAQHLDLPRGVSALFSGAPGTGKTMAASAIAGVLELELVRVDLSAVVSKWVGETEKHLAIIFDRAQTANAMLLFDEADSLFGKRTKQDSAQDRYANLEVNYILQRMETFDGISVLTTNLEGGIDPAFLRRLNFRVRFPEPDFDERRALWQRLLPPALVIDGQVDWDLLASRFEMSGGHIRNAVVRAAVIAARAERSVCARDLLVAAHHEYLELGKVMPSLSD